MDIMDRIPSGSPSILSGTPAQPPLASMQTEDEYEQLKRFQIELEFVQCLANPWYLHNLAQQQYFSQEPFVRYLDYLQYFRRPEYAKFIIYPHCLHFLSLLQHQSFREQLAKQESATFVHERQYYHWQYLRNQDKIVRLELDLNGVIKPESQPGPTSIDQNTNRDMLAPSTTAPSQPSQQLPASQPIVTGNGSAIHTL
ncbi:hypothetical protein BG004_008399 [Podila humilis]|nr:hypothetical protein BG004_008399 [Podila humilis]